MSERRKFKRVEVDIAVRGRLVNPQKKVDLSGNVSLKAKDLSEAGARLEWPRSWSCNTCTNCLGWIYNFDCKLKDAGMDEEESNRDLVPEMHLVIHIRPGEDVEPVETLAKVVWVKSPEMQNSDRYDIGVSFVKADKKEPDLTKKILDIKKKFESN